MKSVGRVWGIFIILWLLLAGCRPAASETSQTATPSRTATVTRLPTVAAYWPLLTHTITPTSTLTPAVPLSQTGPWLAIYDSTTLWVANPDGTGLTEISTNTYSDFQLVSIAPRGGRLAVFYPPFDPDQMVGDPPELRLVTLPSTSPKVLTRLHSGTPVNGSQVDYELDGDVFSVLRHQIFDWSPDGSRLAFLGAQDGPSSDLYVYSVDTGAISRLTRGPTQALDPGWSPDGEYIVSDGVKDMHFATGGSNGPAIDTVWAVRPDGSDLRAIFSFPGDELGPPFIDRVGWVDERKYLEVFSAIGCGEYNLTLVDILVPSQTMLVPGVINSMAVDPESGEILIVFPNIPDDYGYTQELCGNSPEPGLYLVSALGVNPTRSIPFQLPSEPFDLHLVLSWSDTAKLFFVFNEEGIYTVDLQGTLNRLDMPEIFENSRGETISDQPVVSPDGMQWLFYGGSGTGLWLASRDQTAQKIFNGPIDDALWTPDGTTLLFISDAVLYRAVGPEYAVQPLTGRLPQRDEYFGIKLDWVMP